MTRKRTVCVMCVMYVLGASFVAFAKPSTFAWASFPVEREALVEVEPRKYGTVGTFNGVGMMYISAERSKIEFKVSL